MPVTKGMDTAEKVSALVEDFQAAETFRRYKEDEKWIPSLKLMRMYQDPATRKKAMTAGRSSMRIAKAYEQVATILPRIVETTLAQKPVVVAWPITPGQELNAAIDTKLINFQMDFGDFAGKFIGISQEDLACGTAVAMPVWEERMATVEEPMALSDIYDRFGKLNEPQTELLLVAVNAARKAVGEKPTDELPNFEDIRHIAETVQATVKTPRVMWEGPVALHIDLFDVWFDPKATSPRLDNCNFVVRRFYRSLEELRDENKRRKDKGLEPIYKNLGDLKDGNGGSRYSTDSGQARRYSALGLPIDQRDDKRFEILEFHYADGMIYALANQRTLIREGPDILANTSLSVKFRLACHEPQPHELYGTSLIEWVQDTIEGYEGSFNTLQDNINLIMNPPIIADRGTLVNPGDLQSPGGLRPGLLIDFDSELNPNKTIAQVFEMVKFPPDMVTSGWAQLDRLNAEIENTTGAQPGLKGSPAPSRTPYSLVAMQNDEANMRIRLWHRTIGQFVEGIADSFQWLNYKFLPPEYPVTLFGQDGQAYVEHVKAADVKHFFHYRFTGASLEPLANRQAQQQNVLQLMNVLPNLVQMQPALATQIDWTALLRAVISKFEFLPGAAIIKEQTPADNLAMLLQNPQVLQDPQVQQMLMGAVQQMAGGAPGGQAVQMAGGAPGGQAMQMGGQAAMQPPASPQGQMQPPQGMDPQQQMIAQRENDQMQRGLRVYVAKTDDHMTHLAVHAMLLDVLQQALQRTPDDQLLMAAYQQVTNHIQEHQQAMQGAQQAGGMGAVQ